MYPDHIVLPMKQELTNNGFTELKNDVNIKDVIQNDSSIIVVNSDCGCAATNARPGVLKSLKTVSYTHLRAHETKANLVCRLLLEKKTYVSRSHCITDETRTN